MRFRSFATLVSSAVVMGALAAGATSASAAPAGPERCHLAPLTDTAPGAQQTLYSWSCGGSQTATYVEFMDEPGPRGRFSIYRPGVDGAIAHGYWFANEMIWEPTDGSPTRIWTSPQPGFWIDREGPSWLDNCQDCA
jgi:hypothetical protein